MRYLFAFAVAALFLSVPYTAVASKPGPPSPLRETVAMADAVVYGRLENARKKGSGGETDLVIMSVIKSHPSLKGVKTLTFKTFVPDLDPKKPRHVLVFVEVFENEAYPYSGIPASPALAEHVKQAIKLDPKKPVEILKFAFDRLADPDKEIRTDAFNEFNCASTEELGALARTLPAETIRGRLREKNTPILNIRFYALLLSYCGEPKDADEIAEMVGKEKRGFGQENAPLGYMYVAMLSLKPENYEPKIRRMIKDEKKPFLDRYDLLNAVRHVHKHRLDLHKKIDTIGMIADLLVAPDMADFGIEDLRKLGRWEYTEQILSMHSQKKYDEPIIHKSILRFALHSPRPEAAAFVAKMRKKDAEWVQEVKELLDLEMKANPAMK